MVSRPETMSDLKTFIGLVDYLQQFITNLSQHTTPLLEIGRKGVDFYWDANLQNCFNDIKAVVTLDITLPYCDGTKPITIQKDYSKQGFGAVLP